MHVFASIVLFTIIHTCHTNSPTPAPTDTNHEAASTEEEVHFNDLMKKIFKPYLNQVNLHNSFNRINQMTSNATKKHEKEKQDVNSLTVVENLVTTLTAIGKLKLRTLTINLKRILSTNEKQNRKVKNQGNSVNIVPEINRSLGNENTKNKFDIWEKDTAKNLNVNKDLKTHRIDSSYYERQKNTDKDPKIQKLTKDLDKPQGNLDIQPHTQEYANKANDDDKSRISSDKQTKMGVYLNWDDEINLAPKTHNKPNMNDETRMNFDNQPKMELNSNSENDPIFYHKMENKGNKDPNKQPKIKEYANKDASIDIDNKIEKNYDIDKTKVNYVKVESNTKKHADWNEIEGTWRNDDSENVEWDDEWLRKLQNGNYKSHVQENANLVKPNDKTSNIKIDKINRLFEEKMEDLKLKVVKVYLRSVDTKSLALHVLDRYIDLLTNTRQNILGVFENYYSAGDEAMRKHWSYMQDKIILEGETEKARLVKHLCDRKVVCKLYPAFSDHLADFMDDIMYLPDENIHLILKALFHQPQEIEFFIKLFRPHHGKDIATKILSMENDISKSKHILQVIILFVSNKFKVFTAENKVLDAKVKALRIIMDIIDQSFKDQSIQLMFSDLKIGLQNWVDDPKYETLVKSLNMFMKRLRIILTTELNDETKKEIAILSAFVLSGEVNDTLHQLLDNK